MKITFAGQVPKNISEPDLIEDVYSQENYLVALCDGASESFDSKTWAELLANKFCHAPEVNSEWVNGVVCRYLEQFDLTKMSWSKQAAFERGSFSTLLGVQYFASSSTIEITGIGDTIALFIDCNMETTSFPYTSADEFKKQPELLATKPEYNDFLCASSCDSLHKKIWHIDKKKNPHILCMTDALAEWTLRSLRKDHSSLERLLKLDNNIEFEELILSERSRKDMRIDDATLIHIIFEDSEE